MPGLFSLANELLIQIFTACPTVQTAMHLSCVNNQLRSIWLQHTDLIVKSIIKSTIPAADLAIDFAITETRLRNSLSDIEQPPLKLWLPNLMRNADLCASAHAACSAYVGPPDCVTKERRTFPSSSPAHWYFLSRVRLAFEYPQLRDALHAELLTTSKDNREEIFCFHWFLVRFSSMDEAARQGVPRDLRLLNAEPGDEFDGDMHENAWWYQAEVIGEARGDLTINSGDLSLAIQGYNL
jgi:hypothetical protein